MSASPVARLVTQSQSIPSSRNITINSPRDMPMDYSTTPGGTIYSTTPGGTRLVYERAFLMQLRNSPMARTPPKNIQFIPGCSPTKLGENNHKSAIRQISTDKNHRSDEIIRTDEQFEMDL